MRNFRLIPGSAIRAVVVTAVAGILLFGIARSITTCNYVFILLAIGLAILFFLVNHSHLWLILTFGSFYSWIFIPGMPSSLSLFYLLAGGLTGVMAASRLLGSGKYAVGRATSVVAFLYLLTILATMYMRGFGIKAFGGQLWGGADYIHLIIALPFYMLQDTRLLKPKNWKTVMILFFCAGLIPSFVEAVFILSRGQISFLYSFIRPDTSSALGALEAITQNTGVLRFQVTKYAGMLFPLALALFPFRGKYKIYIILIGLLALAFDGLSGHRSAIIFTFLLIPAFMYTRGCRWGMGHLIGSALAIGLGYLLLFLFVQELPLSFQRSVSWIPFLDIDPTAKAHAMGTYYWRLRLYKELWYMIPDYLLIGRGFAFSPYPLTAQSIVNMVGVDWAIVSHNYHNGPLSLLVDLGAAGFTFGSLIFFIGLATQFKFRKRDWSSDVLSRYHAVLCAVFAVEVFRFYVIHGDASYSIVVALVHLAMMEGVVRTDMSLATETVQEDLKQEADMLINHDHTA